MSSAANDIGGGQSPIDICDVVETAVSGPSFEYAGEAARVERVQGLPVIFFDRNSELRIGDFRYRLLQLHWHTPAEHTIDGEEFAAEVHYVHLNEAEELLVVGVVYRLGEPDHELQRIIDEARQALAADQAAPSLTAADHAPAGGGFYHYIGSLTAPPFSEPVQWYVARLAGTASQSQVEQLQVLTAGPNARPLQDRNGRTILCAGCGS